jgi:hypothetical protein
LLALVEKKEGKREVELPCFCFSLQKKEKKRNEMK